VCDFLFVWQIYKTVAE